MGTPLELPPLFRIAELRDGDDSFRTDMSWYQKRMWKKSYKLTGKEKDLSPEKLRIVDIYLTALICSNESHEYPTAYYDGIHLVRIMNDSSVLLWLKEMEREFNQWMTEGGSKIPFINEFHLNADGHHSYHYAISPKAAVYMENLIKLSGAKDKHHGTPLIFKRQNRELLFPYYNINHELTDEELKICEGVVKLHHRWKNNDDSEKQKIQRFVAAHVENIDAALDIIDNRYVDSLDHLDALITQTGDASALSSGAL